MVKAILFGIPAGNGGVATAALVVVPMNESILRENWPSGPLIVRSGLNDIGDEHTNGGKVIWFHVRVLLKNLSFGHAVKDQVPVHVPDPYP